VRAGTFEIVVTGTLSPALVTAFDGFTVSRADNGETHLMGWIDDQARLNGLLELLADLTIELVSVNRLPDDSRADWRP
jgi:hypothetical protein